MYRLEGPSRTCFLKTAEFGHLVDVRHEAERLAWLQGKVPVPEVLHYLEDTTGAFLVTTAVKGRDLTAFNQQAFSVKRQITVELAHGLRQLHALEVAACPFDHTPGRQLALLETALENREASSQGETLQALKKLAAERPIDEDLVFTHGDPCLPNVLVLAGKLSGFIDLGRCAVGDRYRDLALARWSLNYNFGGGFTELFFGAYGLSRPDEAKLAFHYALEHFLYD